MYQLINVNGSSGCSQCLIGQFYDSFNRICQSCPLNCLNCLSSSVCITCYNGYYLNNITKQCTSSCPVNMRAYPNNICSFCLTPNCASCSL